MKSPPRPKPAAARRFRHGLAVSQYSWLSRARQIPHTLTESCRGRAIPIRPGTALSSLKGRELGAASVATRPLWDVAYKLASVRVTNTGAVHSGKAVAQAYIQFPPDGSA